jgi:hypothetical protein
MPDPWIIVVLVVAVVLVALWFVFSRLVLIFTVPAGSAPGGEVSVKVLESTAETGLRLQLRLTGETREFVIDSIDMPRALADALQVSAPAGFREEPLKPEGREANDPETMTFIKTWNAENLRWQGSCPLQPEQEQVFVIPAKRPQAGSGWIQFQYGYQSRWGGLIAQFGVELGAASTPLTPLPEGEGNG